MEQLIKYTVMFFFYSFAGWCLESIYCSIGEKRIVNRGFLTGPLCPIYGAAAVVIIVLIYNPFKGNPLTVFLLGMLLCDIVEFCTSYVMEKLFSARWWDYTYELFNIGGRICLKHTLYWGVISVIFVNSIHPAVDNLYNKVDSTYLKAFLILILIVFVLDLINAVRKALDIRKIQVKINKLTDLLSSELSLIRSTVEDKYALVQKVVIKQTDKVIDLKLQIDNLLEDFEKIFVNERDSDKRKQKLSYRLLYDNPTFERLTKSKVEKLKSIISDIKSRVSFIEDTNGEDN